MESQEQSYSYSPEEKEALIKECKKKIELESILNKLELNPEFKKFMDSYVKDEPVRLVGLLGEPTITMRSNGELIRKDIEEQMIGIARFSAYLRLVRITADQARKTIEDLENQEASRYIEE